MIFIISFSFRFLFLINMLHFGLYLSISCTKDVSCVDTVTDRSTFVSTIQAPDKGKPSVHIFLLWHDWVVVQANLSSICLSGFAIFKLNPRGSIPIGFFESSVWEWWQGKWFLAGMAGDVVGICFIYWMQSYARRFR